VTRYHALRKGSMKVLPSDLRALAEGRAGMKSSLRPHVADSVSELADLAQALGGLDEISEQKRALLEDYARVGLLLRALLTRFGATLNDDTATRIGTLVNVRRQTLALLGLERFERDALDPRRAVEVSFQSEPARDERRAEGEG
jgi:hypothetical protein